ncbi:Uncharacterized protein QTN25_008003 [Entamoeba marina]
MPCDVKSLVNTCNIDQIIVEQTLQALEKEGIISSTNIPTNSYYFPRIDPTNKQIQSLKSSIIEENVTINQMIKETKELEESDLAALEQVHKYNDIKDVGQMLFGKIGQLEGKTIQELYVDYGMDADD